jgi:cytochrome bd ubiquinol oxidase subunit II
METLWFMIVAVMVAGYVVLDGFDLGAGVIYLRAARTPEERQKIMRAIRPVWDGNEVWLVAAGGTALLRLPFVVRLELQRLLLAADDRALAADAARDRH